ncbi:TIGR01777 family oxidoreductase [Amycolatopsis nigrescens]|uniref:TIGR01777 family oxidoreductase n=1 Tax=Amycolatopsis nigrescens TaxID=381445 RepID=UPI00037A5A16|nr:TIGR01777 family oxidoreductase [Amycolatopsis nigrescens]
MRVLIAGASGLIGNALSTRLRESGHEVRRLVRRAPGTPDEYGWDPPAGRIDDGAFSGVDGGGGVGAVVNLCGAPLFPARWSAARKQVLLDSRVGPTEVLAEAVAEHGVPVLLNASAVGFYGDGGARELDESAPAGTGFLADMCVAWEAATAPAERAGARVVRLRTGLVLSGDGGLLGTLKPLFRLALGGKLGSGTQYMPWISLADEVAAIGFLLEHDSISGPVNLTGPAPATNAEFTREFGRALHRPSPWWVPGPALKLVIGQAGAEMALYGQRALPRALTTAGFRFAHQDLPSALSAAL